MNGTKQMRSKTKNGGTSFNRKFSTIYPWIYVHKEGESNVKRVFCASEFVSRSLRPFTHKYVRLLFAFTFLAVALKNQGKMKRP